MDNIDFCVMFYFKDSVVVHPTCALDSNNIRVIFLSCKKIMLDSVLETF